MSTKNLARTVIEGGRVKSNKADRRHSRNQERAQAKIICHDIKNFVDPDDYVKTVHVRPVRKEFTDKLGPALQWLKSKIGRPWDKIRSEIFHDFDPRSLAGQHIIFDHLLNMVHLPNEPRSLLFSTNYDHLFVDEDGILRLNPKKRSKHKSVSAKKLAYWAKGRKVMVSENRLFWMSPSKFLVSPCELRFNRFCVNKHWNVPKEERFRASDRSADGLRSFYDTVEVDGVTYYTRIKMVRVCDQSTDFKQGPVFSAADWSVWKQLDFYQRKEIVKLTAAQDTINFKKSRHGDEYLRTLLG